MDFHILMRRDLQALCKKNKIPANMTNVAMADALVALETVEGLEEFMNQSQCNPPPSPTTTAMELQDTRTATRTTRRKTTKEETQISQSVTRICRVTMKSLNEEMDQKNKNVNVGEAKNDAKVVADVPKTPAAQSTRKRPTAASSRRKAPEIQKDVQQVYSTRRSVRLLEKGIAELSLKGKGAYFQKESQDSEKLENSEITSGKDLSETLEKEWDMRDRVPEDNGNAVPDCTIVPSEKTANLEDVSVFKEKADAHEEKTDELDTYMGEDSPNNASNAKGYDDIPVCENSSEVDSEEPVNEKAPYSSENMTQDDNSVVPYQAAAANTADQQEIQNLVPNEDSPKLVQDLNLDEKLSVYEQSNTVDVTEAEEDEKIPESERSNTDSEAVPDENASSESEQSDIETDSNRDTSDVDSDQSVAGSDVAFCDADFHGNSGTKKFIVDQLEKKDGIQSSAESNDFEDPSADGYGTEAQVEVDVTESNSCQKFKNQFKTETQDVVALVKEQDIDSIVVPMSDKTPTSPLTVVSGGRGRTPLSPFAAESISGQFPRPTLSTSGKSSSKKPKSAQKLTLAADNNNNNNNKENIDNSERKLEQPKKDKVKKGKKNDMLDEESLKGVSLRQLSKMVKELKIKSRPALQTLSGNLIPEEN